MMNTIRPPDARGTSSNVWFDDNFALISTKGDAEEIKSRKKSIEILCGQGHDIARIYDCVRRMGDNFYILMERIKNATELPHLDAENMVYRGSQVDVKDSLIEFECILDEYIGMLIDYKNFPREQAESLIGTMFAAMKEKLCVDPYGRNFLQREKSDGRLSTCLIDLTHLQASWDFSVDQACACVMRLFSGAGTPCIVYNGEFFTPMKYAKLKEINAVKSDTFDRIKPMLRENGVSNVTFGKVKDRVLEIPEFHLI